MAHVLLIDDDPVFLPEQVSLAFRPPHRVSVVGTGSAGIDRIRADNPDVVLLDLRLPDQSGLAVHEQIRAIDARIPVIFITAAKTADSAIEAMKQGAFNYMHKPLDLRQLRRVVGEALEVASRMRERISLGEPPGDTSPSAFIGASPPMLEVWKAIGRVAAQDVAVLISGESGTGKELAARAVYQYSARARMPFLALNCAAIPEPLLESELFGHERGAFTGADRRHVGKFEQCNGGTLLLDEIGDMPLALQAKILRVLQDQTFQRVGGTEIVHTDVRVIASTHRDLRALAGHGQFRSDLYYRLAVFTIEIPALRERGDDIAVLARHFLATFNRELGRHVLEIATESLDLLRAYSWPGNVRELQSVLKQSLLRASGALLLPSFLPELITGASDAVAGEDVTDIVRFIEDQLAAETLNLYGDAHRELDRVLMTRVLKHTNGSQRQAAKLLGISRQTVRAKLRAAGIQNAHDSSFDDGEPPLD